MDNLVNNTTKRIMNEVERRKERCLSYIVSVVVGKGINKKLARRITRYYSNVLPFYEKFILDEGKDSEVVLMEFDLEFKDGFPNVLVTSSVSVSHLL